MQFPDTLAAGALMMTVVIVTAAFIGRHDRFYREDLARTANRRLPLDGLRGLAALMVATYHAALSSSWLATGQWGGAHSRVLQFFGPVGVIIFFMLTADLFWHKARAANGKLKVIKLWRSRVFRIAPLYLFSLVIILIVAFLETGGGWFEVENWKGLLRLLALGGLSWFPIGPIDLGNYNAGVIWTLRYEWFFYLALPFMAWLAVGRRVFPLAILAYVLAFPGLWRNLNVQPGLFFILGMLCPVLVEDQALRARLMRPSAAGVALVASLLLMVVMYRVAGSSEALLKAPVSMAGAIFPLFLAAAAGNSFFGCLTHPALRCLGALSFSLYLLHGIVFRLVTYLMKEHGLANSSRWETWLILIAMAVPVTWLCAVTYRWVEYPFITASHKTAPAKS